MTEHICVRSYLVMYTLFSFYCRNNRRRTINYDIAATDAKSLWTYGRIYEFSAVFLKGYGILLKRKLVNVCPRSWVGLCFQVNDMDHSKYISL